MGQTSTNKTKVEYSINLNVGHFHWGINLLFISTANVNHHYGKTSFSPQNPILFSGPHTLQLISIMSMVSARASSSCTAVKKKHNVTVQANLEQLPYCHRCVGDVFACLRFFVVDIFLIEP